MSEPLVTIVVTQRERFAIAERSLRSLYQTADLPFRLVYIDGRSPAREKRLLARLANQEGFDLRRYEEYLPPNVARNFGLARVQTRYVVFVDNDVVFEPGWLSALVRCAEETGADLVTPLICIGDPAEPPSVRIHFAGGTMHIEEQPDGTHFSDRHNLSGKVRDQVSDQLERQHSDSVEFHCVLARMSLFDKIGPLDEELRATSEHLDLCLLTRQHGGKVYFEPSAVVTYVIGPPLKLSELPFFGVRWSDSWALHSEVRFHQKWGLVWHSAVMRFVRKRRLLGFYKTWKRLETVVGEYRGRWLTGLLFEACAWCGRRFAMRGTGGPIAPEDVLRQR
ncbi:MAG: glycosyltransferase [Arenicellales bacterium]